jgi:hypothetical protein
LYQVSKPKLDTLLDSYFYKLPVCTTHVNSLDSALQALRLTFNSQAVLLDLRTEQRDLKANEAVIWEQRFNNIVIYHKSELKAEKKKRLKITLIAIGEAVLFIIILL